MSFLSRREIRNQLLVLVGTATLALTATTFAVNPARTASDSPAPSVSALGAQTETVSSPVETVDWSDVNLRSSPFSPEGEVATARSKMLRDFEAR